MVTKVRLNKGELKSSLSLGKSTEKKLRLPKANTKFPVSPIDQKKSAQAVATANICHNSQKEIKNAMLNAEYKKACACMEWQKCRFIY